MQYLQWNNPFSDESALSRTAKNDALLMTMHLDATDCIGAHSSKQQLPFIERFDSRGYNALPISDRIE